MIAITFIKFLCKPTLIKFNILLDNLPHQKRKNK